MWRVLVGPPLRARDVSREQITPVEGLSALSLDVLTSVAYGPEAIIVVLAVAGATALHLVPPMTIAIVVPLAILVFSYRQVIDAYPGGGGAYAVTRVNFRPAVSLVAAAALLVDYTLTVAVSIAAGAAALTSAFPGLGRSTVPICLGTLVVITLLNLGDAARAFLLPTMMFIVGLLAIIAIGLVHPLAANTSFGGLPILASLLARDSYLPRLFSLRDDRQVLAPGLWTLAVLSGLLLIVVRGNTQALIPLYAIGVFTGFTLSQSGLVVHWWRTRPPRWQHRAAINALGAAVTAVSTVVFVATKFIQGVWVVVLAIPALIFAFTRVHRYYAQAGRALGLAQIPGPPRPSPLMVVVPLTSVSRLAQDAISQALSISPHVIAVTVVLENGEAGDKRAQQMEQQWARWDRGVPLRVLHTEYASVAGPIVAFVDQLRDHDDEQIVVLIPVTFDDRLRYQIMHNYLDLALTAALLTRPNVVTVRILMPLHLADGQDRPKDDYSAAPAALGSAHSAGQYHHRHHRLYRRQITGWTDR